MNAQTVTGIVGYKYAGHAFCPPCMGRILVTPVQQADGSLLVVWPEGETVEEILDAAAQEGYDEPLNRDREDTYESTDFPKKIYASDRAWYATCDYCEVTL